MKRLSSILVLPEAWWENYLSHHGKEEAGSLSGSTMHLHLLCLYNNY